MKNEPLELHYECSAPDGRVMEWLEEDKVRTDDHMSPPYYGIVFAPMGITYNLHVEISPQHTPSSPPLRAESLEARGDAGTAVPRFT